MTVNETTKVLAYVAQAFPRYFANLTTENWKNMSVVWTDALADYSVEAVMTGVKGYISADSSGFPPAPGQIIRYIHMVGNPADKSGTEAWALVRRAVNVPWDQFEASFATLPRVVQIAVGSPESLKELAQMDMQQFETVAQSNFLRMYEAARRREATENKFTGSVISARQAVGIELQHRAEARREALTDGQDRIKQLTAATAAKVDKSPVKSQDDRSEAPQDRLAQLRARLGGH